MKKKLIIALLCCFGQSFGQPLYTRTWGSLIPIYNKPIKPFSPIRKIMSTPFVAEVNANTGNLFIVSPEGDEIHEYNVDTSVTKLVYKIPGDRLTSIENIKFDTQNNIIIVGRTFNTELGTPGIYSPKAILNFSSGNAFIAKISPEGLLVWCTYFHDITQNRSNLTIDGKNNIYVINKRAKTDSLQKARFQTSGDLTSPINFQDVISKLDSDGNHKWSTFYAKDQSGIHAIEAGTGGVYVYGVHFANEVSNTYFGTPGAFQEQAAGKQKTRVNVFLSKFSFEGERCWSTYFGNEETHIPIPDHYISKNQGPLTVLNDEAYIIATHTGVYNAKEELTTPNVYMQVPKNVKKNKTLSRFSGKGMREWTTYIEEGDVLVKSLTKNELFISATVNSSETKDDLNATENAYQYKNGGITDVFTYTVTLDGKKVNYKTFYGYEGDECGITLPGKNGYYTLGFSYKNNKPETLLASKHAALATFTRMPDDTYAGNFIGYFTLNAP